MRFVRLLLRKFGVVALAACLMASSGFAQGSLTPGTFTYSDGLNALGTYDLYVTETPPETFNEYLAILLLVNAFYIFSQIPSPPIEAPATSGLSFITSLGSGSDSDARRALPPILGQIASGVPSVAAQDGSLPVFGQAAQGIAVGLFSGNKVPDKAVVTPQAGITVTLYNADSTVLSNRTYSLPLAESGIVAGDFNGDGNLDLAVIQDSAASAQGSVAILLGKGDGTFGSATDFPAGPQPISVAMADFNGDGKLDLAVGNSGGIVDILLGKGDGTFAASNTNTVTQNPESMVATDLNGDGKIDLAMLNSGAGSVDQLQVFLGNGDGTFNPMAAVSTGTGLGYLAYTDLNHDSKTDLVIVDPASSAIDVLFGNGNGTFQSPLSYLAAAGAASIALMPLHDGTAAIMVPDQITGNFVLTFATSEGIVEMPPLKNLGTQPGGIATGALNGNDPPDLVITDAGTGGVYVLLNTGHGQFGAPVTYPAGSKPSAVAIADLNKDGKLDVVAADSGGIDVLLGNGNGTLGSVNTFASPASLSSLALADFNSDGNLDVASAIPNNGSLALFAGNGNGTFQPASNISLPGSVVPYTVVSGDFNGDGRPDLAVAYNQPLPSGVSTSAPPGGIYILLGDGNGTFSTPTNIVLPGSVVPQFTSGGFAAADVNGDGKLDLVVAYQGTNGSNQVAALVGKGDGTFQMATPATTLTGAATIVITDLNGDGKPDLVLGDCCGLTEASFMIGNGDGTFQREVQFPSGPSPGTIAAADFNGDGKPDLAIAGSIQMPERGTLTVLFNAFRKAETASIVSAANPAAAAIAPGSLATAYGKDLANSKAAGTPLPLPATFGGTSVSIQDSSGNTTLAPLLYVSPTQVNFEVPPAVAIGTSTITVASGDGTQSIASEQIAAVAPGLFELNSAGLAAAYVILYHPGGAETVEQVYSVTSSGEVVTNAVSLGSSTDTPYLFLFGTGFEAAGTAGVKVSIGGINVPVTFAGSQGGFVGLDQANVELPASLAGKGKVTIQLTADGLAANAVNITFQ